jgi:hypothetical protein
MKKMTLAILTSLLFYSSGCVSYMTMKSGQQEIAERRARIAEDEVAVRAFEKGAKPRELGYNIGAWEAISERPVQQGLALGADILLLWGGYEGVQWLSNYNQGTVSSQKQDQKSGRDNTSIVIEGNGNTVTVSGDTFQQETPVVVVN